MNRINKRFPNLSAEQRYAACLAVAAGRFTKKQLAAHSGLELKDADYLLRNNELVYSMYAIENGIELLDMHPYAVADHFKQVLIERFCAPTAQPSVPKPVPEPEPPTAPQPAPQPVREAEREAEFQTGYVPESLPEPLAERVAEVVAPREQNDDARDWIERNAAVYPYPDLARARFEAYASTETCDWKKRGLLYRELADNVEYIIKHIGVPEVMVDATPLQLHVFFTKDSERYNVFVFLDCEQIMRILFENYTDKTGAGLHVRRDYERFKRILIENVQEMMRARVEQRRISRYPPPFRQTVVAVPAYYAPPTVYAPPVPFQPYYYQFPGR